MNYNELCDLGYEEMGSSSCLSFMFEIIRYNLIDKNIISFYICDFYPNIEDEDETYDEDRFRLMILKRHESKTIDIDYIIEKDIFSFLILDSKIDRQKYFFDLVYKNLKQNDFKILHLRHMYSVWKTVYESSKNDLLSFALECDDLKCQRTLKDILEKKYNFELDNKYRINLIMKIKERNWMEKREKIKEMIQSGVFDENEILIFAKMFEDLKRNPPKIT